MYLKQEERSRKHNSQRLFVTRLHTHKKR